ncbi:hypothetical protein BDF22DRAFT_677822, partial [Syncephalis plumigaleata]
SSTMPEASPPVPPPRQYLQDENPPSNAVRASLPSERLNAGPETWRFALNDDEISRENGPPQRAPIFNKPNDRQLVGTTSSDSSRRVSRVGQDPSGSSSGGRAGPSRTSEWRGWGRSASDSDSDSSNSSNSIDRVPRAVTAYHSNDDSSVLQQQQQQQHGPPPSYHESRADPLFLRGSTSSHPGGGALTATATRPGDEKMARFVRSHHDDDSAVGEGYGQEERAMISQQYDPNACWCPRCETSVIPHVTRFPGVYAVILAIIILVIFWPLFWIPFLFPECMDKRYRCPNCGTTLTPPHDNIY